MSGIDKIIFKLPHVITRNYRSGLDLSSIISGAAQNGLIHRTQYLPNERKPVIGFMDRQNNSTIDGLFLCYRGHREDEIVTDLIVNPSRMESYGAFSSIIGRIRNSLLHGSYVSRIDFAADYPIPFQDAVPNIDVARRSNSTIYLDINTGVPRTIYFGAQGDILMAYDKRHELMGRGAHSAAPLTRLERQLRGQANIRSVFGEDITYENHLPVLRRISNGHFPILDAYSLATIDYTPATELTPALLQKRYMLEAQTNMTSFANARRYLSARGGRNFGRYAPCYRRTLWPEEDQPEAVLRAAIRHFLRDAPSSRRRLPESHTPNRAA